ncbi:hypothetical protein IMZ48_12440, partial [Candidatus Bathyarchaeota archaeon]|nr:hypothetical protein [Candidatus Bathyarchaeota archaeon]
HIGYAAFDLQPHFPSFALFITAEWALILKTSETSASFFERIGVGRFGEPEPVIVDGGGAPPGKPLDPTSGPAYPGSWKEVTIL